MGNSNPSDGPSRIQLDDELEGEHVSTTDYFFVKIGDAVPLKANDFDFDHENLPSIPLAVSERFGLIFVAHSSGVFVARTKDVMDSAKEYKEKGSGSPIQQLSLVEIPIGKVNTLALSADNSTVAASVSGDIRFFSVDSLLSKEVKQSFSCSLTDSSYVKDMHWIPSSEKAYVVLSKKGNLYYGEVDIPLKNVMSGVDAVEWGAEGKFVAVARMNALSILSEKFEERVSITLSGVNCQRKVDSIKWVRPDSIVIGSFQLTEDGKEENYILQVIRSKDAEITDANPDLIVQSFDDIYQGLTDDIFPLGPHLLLTYLEQCQLAISANRKSTDEHIVLLGWSVDDNSEAVVVDIERDNWVPRIELQENGDDNCVLGLCVDNLSIDQKVGIPHGVEERIELRPYCVLICLTLDGKLVMFHVASLAGSEVSPDIVSVLPDEEKGAPSKLPVEECSKFLHGLKKQELEQVPFSLQTENRKKNEVIPLGVDETSDNSHLWASEVSKDLKSRYLANPYKLPLVEDISKSQEVESVANLQSLKPDEQLMVPHVKLNQESDDPNACPSLGHSSKLGQFSSSACPEQFSRVGTSKAGGLESSTDSFAVKSLAASGLPSYNYLQETTETTNKLLIKNGLPDPQKASHQSTGEKLSFTKDSDVSSLSKLSNDQIHAYQNQIYNMGNASINAAKVHASHGRKTFHVQDVAAVNYVSKPVQCGGKQTSVGTGNLEPLPVCSSQVPLKENTTVGRSSLHKFRSSNEQQSASSMLGISTSEPNFTKQFGNIHEMTKELDLLLRSIEEAGGFKDTCTRSLRSAVEELELGMKSISEICKTWMYQVVEQLEEVYQLLDKTIQVVARKTYMEGVFKQVSDSRYWDLWNRQKLNSELELKQWHILSLNQDLTNQLIELERHFNVLELNKFSEYGGTHVGHGAIHRRYKPSRYIQSLYSVHNAMNSQLVAAENLSESLSKQMAELSIKSSSEEHKNVKKELFETIGIPYEPYFGSPNMKNVINTPSSKNVVLCDLITNKDWSKKLQATAFKGCEPEMSRRRRDSLDQSWTCFEPPKTIVRRMLLQQAGGPNLNRHFFSMDKQNIGLSVPKKSCQADTQVPATVLPESEKKGTQVAYSQEVSEHSKAFIWANTLSTSTQLSEFKSPVIERSSDLAVPSRPASQFPPARMHCHLTGDLDLNPEKYNTDVQNFDSMLNGETMPKHMKIPQKSSVSNCSPSSTHSLLSKSTEMSVSNGKTTTFTSSSLEHKPLSTVNSESWRIQDFPFSASSTIPAASTLLGKFTALNVDKSQHGEESSAVPTFCGSCESPSPIIETSSASPSPSPVSLATVASAAVSVDDNNSLIFSNTSIDANQVFSTSSASTSSSPIVSSLVLPNTATKYEVPSFPHPSSLNSNLEKVVISNLKTDLETAKDVSALLTEPSISESKPKLESSRKCSHSDPSSSEQSSNSVTSSTPNTSLVSQPAQSTDAPMQFSTSFPASIVISGKNESLDAGITDEDEMEEEAPEMSNTTEHSLGSFAGFGISSIPNPSTPKSIPFGGSFSNGKASPANAAVAFSVPSGELFRPASFTFPSSQSSELVQSTNSGAFSSGFSSATSVSAATQTVFGQPAQIGSGQQALGSVLGTFGQSRQLGNGLPGSGFPAPSGFGGGFAVSSSAAGFSSGSTGGGFAGIASAGGGFAGVASSASGFSGVASTFGGFAGNASAGGSGFGAVSSAGGFAGASSGGYGAFSSQGSGFAAFGTGGATSKPPELFTQMRK